MFACSLHARMVMVLVRFVHCARDVPRDVEQGNREPAGRRCPLKIKDPMHIGDVATHLPRRRRLAKSTFWCVVTGPYPATKNTHPWTKITLTLGLHRYGCVRIEILGRSESVTAGRLLLYKVVSGGKFGLVWFGFAEGKCEICRRVVAWNTQLIIALLAGINRYVFLRNFICYKNV